MALLADDAIIVRMRADPEPQQTIWHVDCQRTVVRSHTGGMESPNSLEVKRWMTGIGLEKLKLLVGEVADCFRKPFVAFPEARRGIVDQSVRERPAR